MKAKATQAQVEVRTAEIVRIVLDGAMWPLDLCDYVREKEKEAGSAWFLPEGEKPLSRSQIYRYSARAEKVIAESCRTSRKKLIRRHLAQRRNLYARAVSAADVRAALAVLADEAKLLGLYPPSKVEASGPNGAALPIQVIEVMRGDADGDSTGEQDQQAEGADGADAGRTVEIPLPPGTTPGMG